MSNNAGVEKDPTESPNDIKHLEEINNIKQILANQSHRAKCGAVICKDVLELMEEETACMMRTNYIYGILSNIENACEFTNSHAYQINLAYERIDTGKCFLSFVAPYFKYVFEVVRFEEKEGNHEDEEFTKLFKKEKGKWQIVDCELCELCKKSSCDRALYTDKWEAVLTEEMLMDRKRVKEKRFEIYMKLTMIKHGHVGSGTRHKIDRYVMELIRLNFPVEAGKRNRGFKPVPDNKN